MRYSLKEIKTKINDLEKEVKSLEKFIAKTTYLSDVSNQVPKLEKFVTNLKNWIIITDPNADYKLSNDIGVTHIDKLTAGWVELLQETINGQYKFDNTQLTKEEVIKVLLSMGTPATYEYPVYRETAPNLNPFVAAMKNWGKSYIPSLIENTKSITVEKFIQVVDESNKTNFVDYSEFIPQIYELVDDKEKVIELVLENKLIVNDDFKSYINKKALFNNLSKEVVINHPAAKKEINKI